MPMDDKQARMLYGVTMKPVQCTEVWKRKMAFDHQNVDAWSYILINRNAKVLPSGADGAGKEVKGTRTHVNLYNGKMSKGANSEKSTYELGDEKTVAKKLKGYTQCAASDCPIAELVPVVVDTPAPDAAVDSE